MLITQSDDGYFGLRQSLTGVLDKAVASWTSSHEEVDFLSQVSGFLPKWPSSLRVMSMRRKRFKRCRRIGTATSFDFLN